MPRRLPTLVEFLCGCKSARQRDYPKMPGEPVVRKRFRIRGTVQGVGFRPFVFGLANELGLSGFVLNYGDGVLAEVEGLARRGRLEASSR